MSYILCACALFTMIVVVILSFMYYRLSSEHIFLIERYKHLKLNYISLLMLYHDSNRCHTLYLKDKYGKKR